MKTEEEIKEKIEVLNQYIKYTFHNSTPIQQIIDFQRLMEEKKALEWVVDKYEVK